MVPDVHFISYNYCVCDTCVGFKKIDARSYNRILVKVCACIKKKERKRGEGEVFQELWFGCKDSDRGYLKRLNNSEWGKEENYLKCFIVFKRKTDFLHERKESFIC